METNTTNHREWPRKVVDKEAIVTVGQCMIRGTIKDMSANGLFFEPEYGIIDYEIVTGDDCLDHLEDYVTVECEGARVATTIKWFGYQPTYGCRGFGAEFKGALNG